MEIIKICRENEERLLELDFKTPKDSKTFEGCIFDIFGAKYFQENDYLVIISKDVYAKVTAMELSSFRQSFKTSNPDYIVLATKAIQQGILDTNGMIREGQAFSIALQTVSPLLDKLISGSDVDCFYDDSKVELAEKQIVSLYDTVMKGEWWYDDNRYIFT